MADAGQVARAVLTTRHAGSSRGVARFASGEDALVSRLPKSAEQGASIVLEVTRPALSEAGRTKLAHARPSQLAERPAPTLAERLRGKGHQVHLAHRFPNVGHDEGWDDLVADAMAGEIAFSGGTLWLSPTPAMTLIDIDGHLPPSELALAAISAITDAIRRLDLSGSLGIDFPTLDTKSARRAVDESLSEALADWPHERTAMNGFGFVQLVARLERPSLLHRVAADRAGVAARLLLRRAEHLQGSGRIELSGHPKVIDRINDNWRGQLMRRAGRDVIFRPDPALAIDAPYAQLVPL